MIGPMKLIDSSTGLMECRVCNSIHFASLQSGHNRASGKTGYFRGSWQCSNEYCPTQEKMWSEPMQRFVKPDWRSMVTP